MKFRCFNIRTRRLIKGPLCALYLMAIVIVSFCAFGSLPGMFASYYLGVMPGIELLVELHPNESRLLVAPHGANLRPGDLEVYLPTAVYYPDFPVSEGFNLFLNGWASQDTNVSFKCCLLQMMPSGELDALTVVEVQAYSYHENDQRLAGMQSAEYSCSISSQQIASIGSAKFTHVTLTETSCLMASGEVLEIIYPPQKQGTVGICLKISYGHFDPEKMLEWFEYQRMMNVTKVFTYAFDLDKPAMRVFKYYQRIGFLDLQIISTARSTFGPKIRLARYERQVMAAKDCKHRMSGYDYVIVLDINEFLVPREPMRSYYDILKEGSRLKPLAGSFGFDSHDVMLDWGPTRESPLHIMRYWYKATQPNYGGVDQSSRWAFKPKITYSAQNYYNQDLVRNPCTEIIVPHNLYTLLHYRNCKKTLQGCKDRERTRDDTMLTHEEALIENIRRLPLGEILHTRTRYRDILNQCATRSANKETEHVS